MTTRIPVHKYASVRCFAAASNGFESLNERTNFQPGSEAATGTDTKAPGWSAPGASSAISAPSGSGTWIGDALQKIYERLCFDQRKRSTACDGKLPNARER